MTTPAKTMAQGDDPADYTVDQVLAYLGDGELTVTADEFDRVVAAERAGKARSGILSAMTRLEPTPPNGTEATQAAAAAQADLNAPSLADKPATPSLADGGDPDVQGFIGVSPARAKAGGAEDKGLSQRNPAVMGAAPSED